MFDVIVIGARCAGSPTAMLLAHRGYRVLLLDRSPFPSDTYRNHFIQHSGIVQLHRWGLLDRVAASNCPPIRSFTTDFGDFPLVMPVESGDGVDANYAPRRLALDAILVEAAVTAGAELREQFTVHDLLMEDGRVVGVCGRTSGGTSVTERARLVIGADGAHSIVAKAVLAPTYNARPRLTFAYYSYFSGVPMAGIELWMRPDCAYINFPTNDGLTCVAIQAPVAGFRAFRADIEGNFFRKLDRVPELAERVRAGQREERWYGTADLENFFRRPHGPGWALVGDAGYHKDPMLAQGISDAFRDAELLTNAIHAGFSGLASLEEALAVYERTRNEIALPGYEANYAAAAFTPLPPAAFAERATLRAALPRDLRCHDHPRIPKCGRVVLSPRRGNPRARPAIAPQPRKEITMEHENLRPSVALKRLVDGYQVTQAIHVAATLDIADLLRDGPRDTDDLAALTDTHPQTLYRLLRALASVGVFTEDDHRQFALTPLGDCLRSDAPEPVEGWAAFVGRPYHWQAWADLLHSVKTGENAFRHLHGQDVWEYRVAHREENAIFNRAMTALSRRAADSILAVYDFGQFRRIVDVGGGRGALLAAVLAQHPEAHGVLYDLPHVVANAEALLREAGVADRCEVVGGDFFVAVPEGGDAYLLRAILHDWEDVEATAILRSCRAAIPTGGRLLVLEWLIDPPNTGRDGKFSDLNMLVGPGGRERTREEYAALFVAAGFRLTAVFPTAIGLGVIEGIPA